MMPASDLSSDEETMLTRGGADGAKLTPANGVFRTACEVQTPPNGQLQATGEVEESAS